MSGMSAAPSRAAVPSRAVAPRLICYGGTVDATDTAPGGHDTDARAYWEKSLAAFQAAIENEGDTDVLRAFFSGLERAIEVMGANCLPAPLMDQLVSDLAAHLDAFMDRFQERVGTASGGARTQDGGRTGGYAHKRTRR